MASILMLVVGCMSILFFLVVPLLPGPKESFAVSSRWPALMEGIGFILWSRAYASVQTQPLLSLVGSAFLIVGACFSWRLILRERKRKKSFGTIEPSGSTSSGAML